MDLQLAGKLALVTGSTSRIGAAIAAALAGEGASVIVHGRDLDRAQTTVDAIAATGGEARVVPADLSDQDQADRAIEEVQAIGEIDILVNNVGGSTSVSRSSWFDATLEDWVKDYSDNTLVAVRLIRAFVPSMQRRGWARVIQISSRNAISPHPQFPGYGAAKAALNNLTLGLSKALAGSGVTSNGIMPGLFLHRPARRLVRFGRAEPRQRRYRRGKGSCSTTHHPSERRPHRSSRGHRDCGLLHRKSVGRFHDRNDVPHRRRIHSHDLKQRRRNRPKPEAE